MLWWEQFLLLLLFFEGGCQFFLISLSLLWFKFSEGWESCQVLLHLWILLSQLLHGHPVLLVHFCLFAVLLFHEILPLCSVLQSHWSFTSLWDLPFYVKKVSHSGFATDIHLNGWVKKPNWNRGIDNQWAKEGERYLQGTTETKNKWDWFLSWFTS